ncbi:MAG TPA: efflux RND transporter periplasmic adaptor subunit [Limnobacter sp.]|uniref:efflux RND transporter periplasmic adaptor subunit n=1 Tax=Limnobacter sp. TaxID=2003368 RepID=UPI002ED87898
MSWVLLASLQACSPSANTQKAETPAQPAPLMLAQADVVTVQTAPIEDSLYVTGTLQAEQKTVIRSKVSGNILAIHALEGQSVRQGDLLVRIDPTDPQLRVQEREAFVLAQEAQAQQAKTQYDNNQRLVKEGFVSETALLNAKSAFDAAQAQVAVARAQLAQARQQLADTQVKAPFSGVLGPVPVQVGSKVSPDTTLLELLNLRTMELKADVNPDDLVRLKPGQKASLNAGPDLPSFEATLTRISPGSVQGNRTVAVYFKVDNPQQQLRSGQFSTARLALGSTRQGLQVPKTALREVQGKPVVYRITAQNTLQTVPVSTGLEQVSSQGNSLIEVREGLNAGDRIVGVNLGPLPEGATVSIQPTAQ